jgi:hypothetical protein
MRNVMSFPSFPNWVCFCAILRLMTEDSSVPGLGWIKLTSQHS